jgi:hypothetical protein
MPPRFDRLATELIALRAQLTAELSQHGGQPAGIGGEPELLVAQRPLREESVHAGGLFSGEQNTTTWSRLVRSIGFGGGSPSYFARLRLALSKRSTEAGAAIRGKPAHLVMERLLRARPVHMGEPFSGEPNTTIWSRFLRSIGLGSEAPTFFSHLDSRMGLALSKRNKGASVVIHGEPRGLPVGRQSRARPLHARGQFWDEQNTRNWWSVLRSIRFGIEGPSYFSQVGPRIRLSLSQRGKEAGIVTGLVLTALGMLAIGALVLAQFNSFKIEIGALKRDLAGTREKLGKLEADAAVALLSKETKHGADDGPLGSAGVTPAFTLTRDEIQLIRDFIKVPPPLPGVVQSINAGDRLPDSSLAPLPEPIMEKVPKLKGARFTVDRNSAIIVVAPGNNRADVFINPS